MPPLSAPYASSHQEDGGPITRRAMLRRRGIKETIAVDAVTANLA
jgi:hypothetical protein